MSNSSQWYRLIDTKTMNGGVLCETNAQLPSAPVLKQELITEHYAITAKRPAVKEKEKEKCVHNRPVFASFVTDNVRMNRPPKINTTLAVDSSPQFIHTPVGIPPHQQYSPYANGSPQHYFPHPQHSPQFYPYPPQQHGTPVAGPSRIVHQQHLYPPFDPNVPQYSAPPPPPAWETQSVASVASGASGHKRKRSGSAKEDMTGSRRNSVQPQQAVGIPPNGIAAQLPTPPSTSGLAGTPSQNAASLPEEAPPVHGVYVTTTKEEGRKLGLLQNSMGNESIEDLPTRGPPRTTTATVLSVNPSGVATLGSGTVLESDLALLDDKPSEDPKTPTMTSGALPEVDDTPRTKKDKTKKRLDAFSTTSRPTEPMFSIRVDMGQGPTRLALRKDIALAFIGYDKREGVVEETRGEDQDSWVVSALGGPRAPIRPQWPDDEAPWKLGSGRRAKQAREEKERTALLRRYLETSSDDSDDDGAARFPMRRPAKRGRLPAAPGTANNHWDGDATDARAALRNAMGRIPQKMAAPQHLPAVIPAGVIACPCKQTGPAAGSMLACTSCKSWFHMGCIGLEDMSLASSWVCEPCVRQAGRTFVTPSHLQTPAYFGSHERAFRGDQALALAPSPMFAGEAVRAAGSSGTLETRTPSSPTRSAQRARVLSYGNDLWGVTEEAPSTPVATQRAPGFYSTPRPEDLFDVNSTPSRHLNTDPRMAGEFNSTLFSMTPLVGRSRNASNPLIGGDTPAAMISRAGRNVAGVTPLSEGIASRHEFLQGLAGGEKRGAFTEAPVSPSRRVIPLANPESPSPYGSIGLGPRGNRFSHMRTSSKARAAGLGLGVPHDEDEDEAFATGSAVRVDGEDD